MFGRTTRLRRYDRKVRATPLNAQDSQQIVERLVGLWAEFRVGDLTHASISARNRTTLKVYFPCIVDLTLALMQHNQRIRDEMDGEIERSIHKQDWVAETVVLDLYLTDREQKTIDEKVSLRRLQGVLLEHRWLLRQQETQYYQRMSEPFYQDIITLTMALLEANLAKG